MKKGQCQTNKYSINIVLNCLSLVKQCLMRENNESTECIM